MYGHGTKDRIHKHRIQLNQYFLRFPFPFISSHFPGTEYIGHFTPNVPSRAA